MGICQIEIFMINSLTKIRTHEIMEQTLYQLKYG